MLKFICRGLKTLLIMFALQTIFWWYSFAQNTWTVQCEDNPTICSAPAKEFWYYVDFTREILKTINTVQWKWDRIWDYTYIWWLFTNKLLAISGENKNVLAQMIDWISESINNKISTVLGISNLLYSIGLTSYKDLNWFSILFKARPIVRDWKTLLDLETETNNVAYELSVSAMSNKKLLDISPFQKIIDKYSKDKPLFAEWLVKNGTEYKDITNMLIRLNGAMKTFIPYGKIDQFDEFSKWWKDGIYLKFNTETMQEMKLAYSCARWFSKCTSPLKDFWKNIKTIWSSFVKWWTNAKQTFNDANDRFIESIKWFAQAKLLKKSAWEEYLTDTEIDLLRNVYGMDTKKLTKQEWISLRDVLSNINKKTLNTIKSKVQWTANNVFDKQAKANADAEKQAANKAKLDKKKMKTLLKENTDKLKWEIKNDSYDNVILDQDLVADFKNVINVVNKQQTNDLGFLWSTSSVDYLSYYTYIGYLISEVENVIWNKDKNIVKHLGNVCELQCSNKWIDWCFAN